MLEKIKQELFHARQNASRIAQITSPDNLILPEEFKMEIDKDFDDEV
jgi:hypothetical protein